MSPKPFGQYVLVAMKQDFIPFCLYLKYYLRSFYYLATSFVFWKVQTSAVGIALDDNIYILAGSLQNFMFATKIKLQFEEKCKKKKTFCNHKSSFRTNERHKIIGGLCGNGKVSLLLHCWPDYWLNVGHKHACRKKLWKASRSR